MIYESYTEAYQAAQKVRKQHIENGILVKVEQSSYGGFILRLVPIDLMIDNLARKEFKPSSIQKEMCV